MLKMMEAIKKSLREAEDNDLIVSSEPISEKPEITSELVNELIINTGIEDKEQFAKGLQEELVHYETVEKKMDILAKIVAEHLKEIPNYYSLLEEMKAKAKESVEKPEENASITPSEETVIPPIDAKADPLSAVTAEAKHDPSKLDDSPEALKALYEELATLKIEENKDRIKEIKAKIVEIKKSNLKKLVKGDSK